MKKCKFFCTPPGKSTENHWAFLLFLYLLSFLYSLIFLIRLNDIKVKINMLSVYPDFYQLMEGSFFGFLIVILVCILAGILNFREYVTGSRSIYVMRRIPDRWIIVRQCLSVPLAVMILTAATIVLLTFGYFLLFRYMLPQLGRVDFSLNGFWRCFI